jgi:dCMP deaminase
MLVGIDFDTCEPQRTHACVMMGPWPDVRGLCGADTIWAASEEDTGKIGPGSSRDRIDCPKCKEIMRDIARARGDKMTTRATWNQYFMNIAREVATRATCDRKHVGAVIVRDKMILATGYNGSIRGLPHCDEVGHLMEDGHCVRTVHAESNAIVQAARSGTRIEGAEIYVTASPCWPCFKLIANAGITRVVFGEFYRDERIFDVAKTLKIELVDFSTGEATTNPCETCSVPVLKGTRFCEPCLAQWFAKKNGRDVPNEDDIEHARRIFHGDFRTSAR